MKITKLETIFVKPRWLFLRMHTDEGITGLGEPALEGRSQTVAAAVHEIGRYLIGQDPLKIEHHWQAIFRGQFYRGGPILTSALSGIEQAMWDIAGKSLGIPVYKMLGGAVRDRIKVYSHAGYMLDYAKTQKETGGFKAFKCGLEGAFEFIDTPAKIEKAVNNFASLREALGKDVDIAIDFHGRVSPAMAIKLIKGLEPYEPMFIEEPVLTSDVDALVQISNSTHIPIATGERLFTRWDFKEILEKKAAAILQPDISHAGGILETRKIAAMAEAYYTAVAPHCPLGPIALAACLQLDALIPNFLCQEQVTDGDGYLKSPFMIKDGYIDLPEGPGLGVELDDEAIKEKIYDGSWETPRLYHDDNSVADW